MSDARQDLAPDPSENEDSPEEIEASLARVRRQLRQLEQREKQLMQALGEAGARRIAGLLSAGGLATTELEGLMRSTVGSSARLAGESPDGQAGPAVRKAPIRFRHPDQPGLVWSGRGKTPLWVKALEAQGRIEQARLPQDPA